MSKVSFRARALDASKQMPVFIADELPDLGEYAAINRAVAQMPTGMEKEEEMELHLQEAIAAQQSTNVGVSSRENHVIPTPKVAPIPGTLYDELYPPQPAPSKNQLIKVQAALTIDKEQPEYDLDSEDDDWLRTKPYIGSNEFEQIMDLLEGASGENQICQPKEARALLSNFDDQLVDDVYDYWLQKRKAAAQSSVQSLIARVKSESRRETSAVNPNIAFRRRAEKMQTRKNRKNDEESYEKILKLSHDLRKAVTLFEMVKRREKSKLAMLDLDVDVFDRRVQATDYSGDLYNELLYRVKPDFQFQTTKDVSEKKVKSHRKRKSSRAAMDKDLVSHAWLKQNAEDWHRPASMFPSSPGRAGAHKQPKESLDGRFTFKRRRGCVYRAPLLPGSSTEEPPATADSSAADGDSFHPTFLPSRSGSGVLRCVGMTRRRVGRGGRVVFDRVAGADHNYLSSWACSSSSSYPTPSPTDRTGVSSSADSSSRASPKVLYFRPRVPVMELNDDDKEDDRLTAVSADCSLSLLSHMDDAGGRVSYATFVTPRGVTRVPITVGVSDQLYASHRRRLALGELSPAVPSAHARDADPMQQCAAVYAITASAAVMSDSDVAQLVHNQQQKHSSASNRNRPAAVDPNDQQQQIGAVPPCDHMYQQSSTGYSSSHRMNSPVAVVSAHQHGVADTSRHLSAHHNNNNGSNNGHDGPPRKRSALSTDPAPAVQALNYPSSGASKEFAVAARTHVKQKATISISPCRVFFVCTSEPRL
uniref:Enhancer of polycomb-like protein n=1 Tax=Plectus sambesii TaxID=2011161 RepID=A0A914XL98_9BILA